MFGSAIAYLLVFLLGVIMPLWITPLVIRLALAKKIVDAPGVRKIHRRPIPRLGGLAIAGASCCTLAVIIGFSIWRGGGFGSGHLQLAALVAGALATFTVGLVDDIRGLRARRKLLFQVLIATTTCAMGIRFGAVSLAPGLRVELGWLSWPLTVLWIVGITNAVNLIDGLDGLAAGISALACLVIFLFSAYLGQTLMAVLMLSLLGSLLGFLLFNFYPARIFMGDGGTYFLGFILGAGSVMCSAKSSTLVGLALPALTLGLPLFDMGAAVLRRFVQRRSPFSPDGGHIHHRLLKLGFKQHHAVLIMYATTVVLAVLASALMVTKDAGALVILGMVLVLLTVLFSITGAVNVKQMIQSLRQNHYLAREVKHAQHSFEDAELRLREAQSLTQWWEGLCYAAGELEFQSLRLALPSRKGPSLVLTWKTPKPLPEPMRTLRTLVPVRDRRQGHILNMEADAYVNGSLEAAGRRTALLGRLLDECGPTSLRPVRRRLRPRAAPRQGGLRGSPPSAKAHRTDPSAVVTIAGIGRQITQ